MKHACAACRIRPYMKNSLLCSFCKRYLGTPVWRAENRKDAA